ncbi:MAG: sugar phosphate isomerase/epimerase family protein [Candidatus Nanohaloarchaea archaeon]
MRTGFSIGPFPDRVSDVPDEFDFVELSLGEHEIPPDEIDADEFRGELEKAGKDLVVHLPFRQPAATSVPAFNEAELEYMEELLEFSAELGASKAVLHGNVRDAASEDELEKFREQVDRLEEISEDHGIEICYENVGQVKGGVELFTLGEILEEKNASMTFDVGHAYMEVGQDRMEDFLDEYSHLVSHLHVHDCRDRGDSHISVGEGEIEFGPVADMLESPSICIEVFTDDVEYGVVSLRKFLEKF